jgi:GNAT superfamily N-acetyltransferase
VICLSAEIQIRAAQTTDADDLFQLAKEFATSFAPEKSAFDISFKKLLMTSDACLAVAESEGKIIGYVLGFDHDTFYANGRVAWVEEIMVHADFRKKGIGKLLMAHFEKWARVRNSKLIALATRRASSFYKAIGYEESAVYFRKLL